MDRHGSLIFTRTLGHQRIQKFCLDKVQPTRSSSSSSTLKSKTKFSIMVAAFCQPSNVTEINELLQTLVLKSSSMSALPMAAAGQTSVLLFLLKTSLIESF